jgi:hypothetical protein
MVHKSIHIPKARAGTIIVFISPAIFFRLSTEKTTFKSNDNEKRSESEKGSGEKSNTFSFRTFFDR